MRIHEDDKPPIVPYLITSIAVHILVISLFPFQVETPSWKEKLVEVIPVYEKNQSYEIADIARPVVEKQPKKARFLGMYNSSVEQETVAISGRQGTQSKQGKRGEKSGKSDQRSVISDQKKEKSRSRTDEEMIFGKKSSVYNLDRKLFAMKTPDIGSKGMESGGATEALADYYPDYKIGARTYLNVLRYPDVEYFVRMKRQFKITFNPVPSLRNYFTNNRVTRGTVEVVLAVSVNSGGNLSELFVLNGSGIPSYDQEAMRTIRASAPFATPPDKFLEDDGLLRMSWTFTVYL